MTKKNRAYYVSYGVLSTGLDIIPCTIHNTNGGRYDISVAKFSFTQGSDVYSTPTAMRLKVKQSHIAFTKKEARLKANKMILSMYLSMREDVKWKMLAVESLE